MLDKNARRRSRQRTANVYSSECALANNHAAVSQNDSHAYSSNRAGNSAFRHSLDHPNSPRAPADNSARSSSFHAARFGFPNRTHTK